ncbi:MAG: geranylgeranylglyceryl/heptaprenylglyceryl phosphate synthase [Chitinophagales bacterium]|nr:geranylgeranylglyceryl/heptaprenylglyceryl phosphate synthase [Bacteroidota bacterium]MCB9043323.1 geranylgeranylglyceryl/heptaprenylglyceryl phosphate synthase [Chitinophagales bacterium]
MITTVSLYQQICEARQKGKKLFAVLIDPDVSEPKRIRSLLNVAQVEGVDLLLVGGSLVANDNAAKLLQYIRSCCTIPTVIFPGSLLQVNDEADAILLLSLVSGRNPELLIGQHVVAAPILKKMNIEVISTAYMLVDGGAPTTVSYVSNTQPIPHNKPLIAACTAMAAEMIGMKLLYLDTGSGAPKAVSEAMIESIRSSVELPIIVGGGIRKAEQASALCKAGADVIVVGTLLEDKPHLLKTMANAIHNYNEQPTFSD